MTSLDHFYVGNIAYMDEILPGVLDQLNVFVGSITEVYSQYNTIQ